MVSKGPICDRRRIARHGARPVDHSSDPMIRIAAFQSMTPYRVPGAWIVLVLFLLVGCAPTTDEDVRLAGIGTARAVPDPKPMPHFTKTDFVTADGQILPLRQWLPKSD